MKIDLLADDLRYKNLLAKIKVLEDRIDALENNRASEPKPAKVLPQFKAMAEICQPIADAYVMTLDELRGRAPMNGCPARAKAMQACRDAGFSLHYIGRFFDGRDNTSVRQALGMWGKGNVKNASQGLQFGAQNA